MPKRRFREDTGGGNTSSTTYTDFYLEIAKQIVFSLGDKAPTDDPYLLSHIKEWLQVPVKEEFLEANNHSHTIEHPRVDGKMTVVQLGEAYLTEKILHSVPGQCISKGGDE